MNLRWDVIAENAPAFAWGVWTTLWISGVGMALSFGLGVMLVLPLVSSDPRIRIPAQMLVEAARSVPFLLLVYLIYYGLPTLKITLDSWTTSLLTIVIYSAAYVAEILRSAWVNLPIGQTEAARSVGFTGFKLLRRIILPQIVLASAPLLGNQLIQVIRDSSFLAVITVPELTFTAKRIQSDSFVPFESFITAAILYWGLGLLAELAIKRLEHMRNIYGQS